MLKIVSMCSKVTLLYVYNVHSLIHLHQEVEHFHLGLQEMSAFPFENFMQNIKRMVRKGQSPLSQIVRRISEFELSSLSGKSIQKVFIQNKRLLVFVKQQQSLQDYQY